MDRKTLLERVKKCVLKVEPDAEIEYGIHI